MQSYMEMIYIDTDDQARHTDVSAAADSNRATWAAFQSYRHLDVGSERAQFLLDYHNAKGDLASTIYLDAKGFTAVSGENPKTDTAYRKIDRNYWTEVRALSRSAAVP